MKPRTTGDMRFRHPLVGRIRLGYESLPLAGTGGQWLIVYMAKPGMPEHGST